MSLNQIDLQVGGYAMQFAGLGKYAYAPAEDAYFTRTWPTPCWIC